MSESRDQETTGNRVAKFGMLAYCLVMVAPVAVVFLAGGVDAVLGNVGLLLPLALCLAMHVVMHRAMGRSCHGAKFQAPDEGMPPDGGSIARAQPATLDR